MRKLLTLLNLLLAFVAISAQPSEFDPAPCFPNTGSGSLEVMSVGGYIGMIGTETPSTNDWVAAIDAQGHIIGREPLVADASGLASCGSTPGPFYRFNISLANETPATGDLNFCPAAPYGGSSNELITLVVWDADGDNGFGAFYSLPAPIAFVQGGFDNSSLLNCTLLDFSMIYTDFTNPLPIVLNFFTAELSAKNKVDLNWGTSHEAGAKQFEVERSADGENWNQIGVVAAAGDSEERELYAFRDETPLNGTSYYRLRQVDWNGAAFNSGVQMVTLQGSAEQGFSFSPNPVAGNTELTLRLDENWDLENTSAVLFDVSGREVVTFQQLADVNKLSVPVLPAGMYTLRVTDNRRNGVNRLIVR